MLTYLQQSYYMLGLFLQYVLKEVSDYCFLDKEISDINLINKDDKDICHNSKIICTSNDGHNT